MKRVSFVAVLACLLLPGVARSDEIDSCATAAEQAPIHKKSGKLVEARKELEHCARDVCPKVVRDDCRALVGEVDKLVPTVIIAARDSMGKDVATGRLFVDDVEIASSFDGHELAIDPGKHVLRFEREGSPAVTMEVVIRVGEKQRRIDVTFAVPKPAAPEPIEPAAPPKPEAPSAGVPGAAWVFGSVGLVGVAGFAYFGLKSRSELAGYRDGCAPRCNDADVDATRRKALVADISLGVGLVAIGVATVLVVTSPRNKEPAVSLSLSPTSGGAVTQLFARF